jgi:hypothetical protein
MSLMRGGMGYHAPHHLCECGEYAERNEYGELLCETCAMFTDRALRFRSKSLQIDFELKQETIAAKKRHKGHQHSRIGRQNLKEIGE